MESRLTWKSPGSTVPPGPPSSPDWMALTMFTMCFLECKELEPVEMTCWAIFLQNSLYNWKMIAMRVVVKPYEGIFTMDDTRSLLYLVQFGTSGTCVLPSMEVFELDFSCGLTTEAFEAVGTYQDSEGASSHLDTEGCRHQDWLDDEI